MIWCVDGLIVSKFKLKFFFIFLLFHASCMYSRLFRTLYTSYKLDIAILFSNFKKKSFTIFFCLTACVYSSHRSQKREIDGVPGVGVTGSCEPSDMRVRDQIECAA